MMKPNGLFLVFFIACLFLFLGLSEAKLEDLRVYPNGLRSRHSAQGNRIKHVRPRMLNEYSNIRSQYSQRSNGAILRGRAMATCPTDQFLCGLNCVDLKTSNENCGVCANICPASQICCLGQCVDSSSDADNCGVCGHTCSGQCTNGMCGY